ncbi:uncharacterized protein LOC121636033 [Melanotaenia boesemani]|uniref:uncharacterized protein LOC121636033 n=1 Tax=Melanotaenia boesemani TaxID=1250792 RepID=UPI001C049605|nr:uncharacterized protein LOC121636033 [Melanotaenia boesemani]
MDDFVKSKLVEWQLLHLIDRFSEEAIGEESFGYLDLPTIATLIPRIGDRLKFIKKHNEFVGQMVCSQATPPGPQLPPSSNDLQEMTAPAPTEMTANSTPEMIAPPSTIVLQTVPTFDIRTILSDVVEGRAIVQSLDTDQLITIKQRRAMVRILVSHLIEKCGETPSAVTKTAMSSALINSFPCLKDASTSGFDTWYTHGRSKYPATGFLEERLRNIRKRLRSSGGPRPQMSLPPSVPRTTVIPAPAIPEERAVQCAEWLKNNTQPITQVNEYMRDTCSFRAAWIRADHSKTVDEVLAQFPRLLTPGMIAQDFAILHGEAAPKFFEKWVPLYADKIINLAKREGKFTDVDGRRTQGNFICCANIRFHTMIFL